MKIHVVINPAAGQDQPMLGILSRVFDEHDVHWQPWVTTRDVDARTLTERALSEGAEIIAAYGGDGTVSEVAGALVGGDVPLAILPGGTGNAVSQELGIPRPLAQSALLAVRAVPSEVRSIDTLRVGQRSYLLRVGVGADARIVVEADRERKDRLGWAAYLLSALAQIREPHRANYHLWVDGEEIVSRALTCVVANIGRLGRGGLSLAREIDPTDGFLDVLLIRDASPGALASVGSSILGLAPDEPREDGPLLHLHAKHVRIETDPVEPAHGDGDPFETDELEVELLPASLPVIVPALGPAD